MDGEEMDRVTHDVAPLTDDYPKRLTDGRGTMRKPSVCSDLSDGTRGVSALCSLFADNPNLAGDIESSSF